MDIGLIVGSFLKALGQLHDARFRRVVVIGVGWALAALIALTALVVWGAGHLWADGVTLPWIGTITWVNDLLGVGGFLGMMVLSVFLMVPIASAISGLFLEDVAEAVEDEYYPELGRAPRIPFLEGILDAIGFLGVIIIGNLIGLIFYIFLAPVAAFIFWALNGYLLGREYFTLAAMRREGRDGATLLRKKHGLTVFVGGVLMAVPLTIPIVNLLVPVLGAATFTHIYNGLMMKPPRA